MDIPRTLIRRIIAEDLKLQPFKKIKGQRINTRTKEKRIERCSNPLRVFTKQVLETAFFGDEIFRFYVNILLCIGPLIPYICLYFLKCKVFCYCVVIFIFYETLFDHFDLISFCQIFDFFLFISLKTFTV